MTHLLKSRRFLPLFLVQFLGAFNDNVFKNALVMLMTFKLAGDLGWSTTATVNMIMVLFLFPSIFLSAVAGQMADRFEKSRLIRWTKLGEIGIMVLAAFGFWYELPYVLMGTIFLAGVQISLFGPLKYGILPDHLEKNELLAGSSSIEAATFAAILLGTILGGLALEHSPAGTAIASWLPWAICALAVAGWLISRLIPAAPSSCEPFRINWNIFSATRAILVSAKPQVGIWRSMLGLSWFWTIGSIWLAFIPTYVAGDLHASNSVATLFITIFSLGIGLGALACQRLLKGEISAKYVPLAGLAISFFTLAFVFIQWLPAAAGFSALSLKGILICVCLLGIAIASGIFSVPLYTIIQAWSDPAHCSRNIAANNILNGVFMVTGNGLVALLAMAGVGGSAVLTAVALLNIGVSIYVIKIIPESVLHTFLRWLLRALYHVKVAGLENYGAAKARKVIIANHVSYLDAALLAAFLPELPTFAVNTHVAEKWWMRPALWFLKIYPVDPSNPMAIKSLTRLVKSGVPVVIFPEGRLTVTGRLMKVYQGPGMMAVHGDADILPVQLDGVQFSRFSYLGGKIRQRMFPDITITIMPPVRIEEHSGNTRDVRSDLSSRIYDIMSAMSFSTAATSHLLFDALMKAKETHGGGFPVVDDIGFAPMTYRQLVAKSLALGPGLAEHVGTTEPIGILLPNSKAAVLTFFGIQATGRPAALLNFSVGTKSLLSTCKTARIRYVWTSAKFLREANLQETADALAAGGVEVRCLEDLKTKAGPATAVGMASAFCLPGLMWSARRRRIVRALPDGVRPENSPAVILFTSGSSGEPKAVVLSHKNLLSNIQQLFSQIDLNRQDIVFNCLPVFHSFGLTGGTLSPVLGGVKVFMYPSPLHFRIVPELVYQTNATILFGTNTFLNGYSKKAHPYDFHSVRYTFAGAEKVKEATKRVWADDFGVRLLEGYGSTECSPGISMNTPMYHRAGTVGRFLPGIEHRLEPVPGIEAGGRLYVKGPNIMLGYYLPGEPGKLVPPEDGWYDTGDIVSVDEDGFITILGRAKRFAKIAGEMVSLAAVEELASAVWPGVPHAAVAIPHPQKGEEIVLFTEWKGAGRKALLEHAKQTGVVELAVPRTLVEGPVPLLGTGKPDYVRMQQLAESAGKAPAEEEAD